MILLVHPTNVDTAIARVQVIDEKIVLSVCFSVGLEDIPPGQETKKHANVMQ